MLTQMDQCHSSVLPHTAQESRREADGITWRSSSSKLAVFESKQKFVVESTPSPRKRHQVQENRKQRELGRVGGKRWTHVDELLDFRLPQVTADLGGQQHARRRHQLPVLLVEAALQHQLLKVNKGHRRGDRLQTELLAHGVHLPLQAVQGGRVRNGGGGCWLLERLVFFFFL